ncbi:MAG: hypothetical protein M3088_01530 [Actinomycetota bacterium]|nr:hypothetical protein [Actinomycetota bacterium]
MRHKDPRRLLARRRHARARVNIVEVPQSDHSADGSVTSRQTAEVTLPRSELDRIWNAEYLERLARTYWRFLTRVSLGLLRVLYTETSREIALIGRPFVLLRFQKPEYEIEARRGTVTWRIDKGLLVARRGRGKGFLRISVRRRDEDGSGEEITGEVSAEVANFYPAIAGRGWFARVGRAVYRTTQLRIHVIVTHAFLRSLAALDLEQSKVGALKHRLEPESEREEEEALSGY